MRVFKSELREALRNPGQLPDGELSEAVEYDGDEAFLRRLWHDLYGDEPLEASRRLKMCLRAVTMALRISSCGELQAGLRKIKAQPSHWISGVSKRALL
jgi:hypothetical protein